MNRTEAIAELERLREELRASVTLTMADGFRKWTAKRIAAITYAIDEMHRMEGLEK